MNVTQRLEVSLPTFTELAERVAKTGFSDFLQDDGTISFGDVVVIGSHTVPQSARLAARIADTVRPAHEPDVVYSDDKTKIRTTCCKSGVTVIVEHEGWTESVMLPRHSLPGVAAELVDCMGKVE